LIGVSVCYALAGLCLGVAGIFTWIRFRLVQLPQLPSNIPANIIPNLSLVAKFLWLVGAILLVLGILPAIKRSVVTICLSLIPCLIIVPALVKAVLNHQRAGDSIALLLGLLLSFFCDVGMLVAVRISLRSLTQENRIPRILMAIAVQVTVIALLVVLPFEMGGRLLTKYGQAPLLIGFGILAIFNIFTALAAALFLLTLLFVLLHRLFWPMLDRIIYPVAARRLLADSTVMTTFGTACIALASPMVWHVLKALADLVGKPG
jgi:hypothetical protein